ncbi:unnamed protein product [Notodromas monacha]|uniref:Gamma-tubulin complex component n=1 Tax=Notodromas monacha TaxID=399045 RepID=A0A7R9BSW6_9CRUS|nr:unnamed protein product [Notodromas monacha]CAG0920797.1 unnamed protein product [Notodromas monacha]
MKLRKPRNVAEQLYWDLELDKFARRNTFRLEISDTPKKPQGYRVGSNVSKFDAILSSCPDEKMKVEVKRNLQVWDTKNPRNLEKFLELIALVCNDRELRSSMESVFSSSRSWVGHASSSSIRSAPKMVDPNQAKENIKAILGTPRVRENSVAESSSTFLSGSLREPSHNDVLDTVRAIPRSKKFGTIGRLPIEVQEDLIVVDLIGCLLGKEGSYILHVIDDEQTTFVVDHSLDDLLANQIKGFIPLLTNIRTLHTFVEFSWNNKKKCGRIIQSIAGYIRKTIYEFRFLVDQLDDERRSRGLKLLAIWAGVQDAVLNFDVLARIARTIMSIDLRSGALLSFLRRGDFSAFSDGKVQRMMTFVQNRAYAPFLHMLECWIYRGMLDDPYEEFFVVRNQEFATENVSAYYSEDYWTGAYGVPVTEMVPDFLQGQLALQVLNTGKYINVIKKSGHTFRCPFEAPIPFSDSDKPTVEAVKKAHAYASNALMKVLIDEHDLLGILGAIKHYFLMDKADFIEEFMLLCDNVELGGCIGDVNLTRLNTLLELALRISIGENEVYKDYLKGSLKQYGLEAELCKIVSISTKQEHEWDENMKSMSVPVWEAFTLTYDVQWPISLVIELRSMTCYQMLFRHFFHLKRVVRLLTRLRISPRPRKMTRTGQSGLWKEVWCVGALGVGGNERRREKPREDGIPTWVPLGSFPCQSALSSDRMSNLQQQRLITEQLRREANLKRISISQAVEDIKVSVAFLPPCFVNV